jgi:SRSO17 transposase
MTMVDLDQWGDCFAAFQARFADLFARRQSREQAGKYLRGLLAPVERKNGWQLAEAVGDAVPDRTQRLLYRVQWDADLARDRLQAFIIETFSDPEGIGVVDETGFLKKGTGSVGVQRQYSGTAGKVENCQVATVLSYATPKGQVFLDRRLYLPESWCADAERRKKAKVPQAVGFQTKPEQAMAMLKHAWEQGVPMRWVRGDEVYGDSPQLRENIEAQGRYPHPGMAGAPATARADASHRRAAKNQGPIGPRCLARDHPGRGGGPLAGPAVGAAQGG